MQVQDAVTTIAAFLGAYLGQRHAAGRLVPELRALALRVQKLEKSASRFWRGAGVLHRRVVQLERAQEARREA
jgi:hypothetical protein